MASWCAKSSEQRNRSRRSNKPAIWRGRAYKKVRRGIDHVGERRQEQEAEKQRAKREERRQRETESAAIDRYLVECRTGRWRKSKKPMRPGYFEETRRSLEVDVKPVLGDRAIREITRGDIRALLDGIVDKGSPSQANHALAYLRAMLNWAVSNHSSTRTRLTSWKCGLPRESATGHSMMMTWRRRVSPAVAQSH